MSSKNQIAAERMFLNADRSKILPAGHEDAAFLYAGKGDEIPASACDRFGIKNGKVPSNKGGKPSANKGGSKPSDKAKLGGLTTIKGIGDATAGALVAAGIADVAALAAVDPVSPPTVETLPPSFSWSKVVAAAKEASAKNGGGE